MMRASPGEAGGVLRLPCTPKPASESLRRWDERDLPACLSGARGLVARAPGARQTPGRFQPVGYVGQAHLPAHAAPRARAAGTAGPGGDSCCPRQPLPGPGDPGTGREPQPICARAVVPAEPLCYLILVFEGESQHLASLVRLVPWGTPRGSRVLGCPR